MLGDSAGVCSTLLETPNSFPKWFCASTLPTATCGGSLCSSPTLDDVRLFNFCHSHGCVVVSHYGFNVHFHLK